VINNSVIKAVEQAEINKIYNRIFKDNVQPTTCGSCLKSRIVELKAVYSAYEA
jgi:hypothetical protein